MNATVAETDYFQDNPTFYSRTKNQFHFISLQQPDLIKVWKREIHSGWKHDTLGAIRITDVDSDTLKTLNVWEQLSQELQKSVIDFENGVESVIRKRMEVARNSRRNKYPNLPREVTCSQCGKKQKIPPVIIVQRAERISKEKQITYTAEDYCKNFVCQECHPTKGRKANHNLPPKIELKCQCGHTVTYPASIAINQAKKKGLTVEKYQASYQCQTCHPTKGRHKKSS